MNSINSLKEEEAKAVLEFFKLPLASQGMIRPLLTTRAQFILDFLECLSDGQSKTYEDIAQLMGKDVKTTRIYVSQLFKKQKYLPVSCRIDDRKQLRYWHRLWSIDSELAKHIQGEYYSPTKINQKRTS